MNHYCCTTCFHYFHFKKSGLLYWQQLSMHLLQNGFHLVDHHWKRHQNHLISEDENYFHIALLTKACVMQDSGRYFHGSVSHGVRLWERYCWICRSSLVLYLSSVCLPYVKNLCWHTCDNQTRLCDEPWYL